jgi:hypothetical protein
MQIKKNTTLTSSRFRCDKRIAMKSVVAMFKVKQASTYQPDPTGVVGNPANQLQTNDVAHGETLLGCTEQENVAASISSRAIDNAV